MRPTAAAPRHRKQPLAALRVALILTFVAQSHLPAQDTSPQPAPTINYVLELDGEVGNYVELPPAAMTGLTDATVEGWVKWTGSFGNQARFFDFGDRKAEIYLNVPRNGRLKSLITGADGVRHRLTTPDMVDLGEWCHVALVTGSGGMKLFFNGELVASDPFTGSPADLKAIHFYLGRESWSENRDSNFQGQIDEVRIWKVVRTEEEIRGHMMESLTGEEDNLVALWNFEGGEGRVVSDAGPRGLHGTLKGDAKRLAAARPTETPVSPTNGPVLDLAGDGDYVQFPDGSFEELRGA